MTLAHPLVNALIMKSDYDRHLKLSLGLSTYSRRKITKAFARKEKYERVPACPKIIYLTAKINGRIRPLESESTALFSRDANRIKDCGQNYLFQLQKLTKEFFARLKWKVRLWVSNYFNRAFKSLRL